MTVNYMREAANANVLNFIKLLLRWRASVWKIVGSELCGFLALYYLIALLYHGFMANTEAAVLFEQAVHYCKSLHAVSSTVLTFAQGFYLTQIYNRWWAVFMMIPWPDNMCLEFCAYLRPRGRAYKKEDTLMRMNMMRYVNLSFVLTFRDISERIMQRFPTYAHLGDLMTAEEQRRLKGTNQQRSYWMPLEWVLLMLRQCYNQKQIDEIHFSKLTQTVVDFRERLHNVMQYDWVNVPLVYTQVVQLCTFSFFLLRVLTAQTLKPDKNSTWLDGIPIPAYAILEFLFFVGWLKCAQVMINPFGMDDDDFDIDTVIERNYKMCNSAMTNIYEKPPKLVKIDLGKQLPHTMTSAVEREVHKMNPMIGSATGVEVSHEQAKVVDMSVMLPAMRNPPTVKITESNTTLEVSAREKTALPTPKTSRLTVKNPSRETSKTSSETCREIPKPSKRTIPSMDNLPSTQQLPSTQRMASTQNQPSTTERLQKPPPKTPKTSIVLAPEDNEQAVNMDETIDADQIKNNLYMLAKVQKKRRKLPQAEKEEEESRTQSESDSRREDERPMGTPVGSSLRAASTQMGQSDRSNVASKIKTQSVAPSLSVQQTPEVTLALSPPKPGLKKSGTTVSRQSRQSSNDGKRPQKSRSKFSARKQPNSGGKKSTAKGVVSSTVASKLDKTPEASGLQGSRMRKTSEPSLIGKKKSKEGSKNSSSGKKKSEGNLNKNEDFLRKLQTLKAKQEQQNTKQPEEAKKK